MTPLPSTVDPELKSFHWSKVSREAAVSSTGTALGSHYDVAIVGGGYCGLSIALHASAQGLSVVVFEAGDIGTGASGRNGGFAVPQFPGSITPGSVQKLLGRRKADRLCEIVSGGAAAVFDQIRKYQISCDAEQGGWVQPAHSQKALVKARAVFDDWKAFGAPVEWLDRGEVTARLGTPFYHGGWFNPTGGTVNPYALCQGLARAAMNQGAHIAQHSPVTAIERDGEQHLVRVRGLDVKARKVVIATNGYTGDLFPDLSKSVIPLRLFHTVTRPLSEDEQTSILPRGLCYTDFRKSGGFCRYDRDGRVVSGGAVFALGNARAGGARHAKYRFRTFFPGVAPPEIEEYWEGYCALTPTYLPHVQVLDKGVYAVLGFSTRGVALAQNLGKEFADYLCENLTLDDMPVEVGAPTAIPWQPVKTIVGGYAFPVFKAADRFGLT